MSVLIKGMEMPQRCKECDLFLEDVRKTGRHYGHIGKLLEAIRA